MVEFLLISMSDTQSQDVPVEQPIEQTPVTAPTTFEPEITLHDGSVFDWNPVKAAFDNEQEFPDKQRALIEALVADSHLEGVDGGYKSKSAESDEAIRGAIGDLVREESTTTIGSTNNQASVEATAKASTPNNEDLIAPPPPPTPPNNSTASTPPEPPDLPPANDTYADKLQKTAGADNEVLQALGSMKDSGKGPNKSFIMTGDIQVQEKFMELAAQRGKLVYRNGQPELTISASKAFKLYEEAVGILVKDGGRPDLKALNLAEVSVPRDKDGMFGAIKAMFKSDHKAYIAAAGDGPTLNKAIEQTARALNALNNAGSLEGAGVNATQDRFNYKLQKVSDGTENATPATTATPTAPQAEAAKAAAQSSDPNAKTNQNTGANDTAANEAGKAAAKVEGVAATTAKPAQSAVAAVVTDDRNALKKLRDEPTTIGNGSVVKVKVGNVPAGLASLNAVVASIIKKTQDAPKFTKDVRDSLDKIKGASDVNLRSLADSMSNIAGLAPKLNDEVGRLSNSGDFIAKAAALIVRANEDKAMNQVSPQSILNAGDKLKGWVKEAGLGHDEMKIRVAHLVKSGVIDDSMANSVIRLATDASYKLEPYREISKLPDAVAKDIKAGLADVNAQAAAPSLDKSSFKDAVTSVAGKLADAAKDYSLSKLNELAGAIKTWASSVLVRDMAAPAEPTLGQPANLVKEAATANVAAPPAPANASELAKTMSNTEATAVRAPAPSAAIDVQATNNPQAAASTSDKSAGNTAATKSSSGFGDNPNLKTDLPGESPKQLRTTLAEDGIKITGQEANMALSQANKAITKGSPDKEIPVGKNAEGAAQTMPASAVVKAATGRER